MTSTSYIQNLWKKKKKHMIYSNTFCSEYQPDSVTRHLFLYIPVLTVFSFNIFKIKNQLLCSVVIPYTVTYFTISVEDCQYFHWYHTQKLYVSVFISFYAKHLYIFAFRHSLLIGLLSALLEINWFLSFIFTWWVNVNTVLAVFGIFQQFTLTG